MKHLFTTAVAALAIGCGEATIPTSSSEPLAKMSECLTGYCRGFEGVWKSMRGNRYLYIGDAPYGNRKVFAWDRLDEVDFEYYDQYLLAEDESICFVASGADVLYEKVEILSPNRIKFWIDTYNRFLPNLSRIGLRDAYSESSL